MRRYTIAALIILSSILSIGASSCWNIPGPPKPKPTPTPVPKPCLADIPWCHLLTPPQQCSTIDSPCKHNPKTDDPNYCELAPKCVVIPPPPTTCIPACESWQTCVGEADVFTCLPTDKPPPPPTGCRNVEADLIGIEGVPSTTTQIVIDAIDKIKWYSGTPQDMLKNLANQIILDGRCAFGGKEAIFVIRDDKLWGEHHAVYFNDGITGKWNTSAKYMLSHREKTPPPDACGLPIPPPLQNFNLKYTPGRKWPFDATPQVHGCDFPVPGKNFCAEIGLGEMPGQPGVRRCDCPAGNEDNSEKRQACERKITGGGLWRSDGITKVNPDNPFLANCTSCTWIEICHADGTKCKRISI